MTTLDFTLVTTCRNEMRSFDRWKQNVLEQTRPPSEIVIVDAFSDDGTAEKLFEWAKNDTRVKVIQEKGNAAHGRNTAIQNSKYEILLSTDMGVRFSHKWCEELITPFENDPLNEVTLGNTCIDVETLKTAISRAEYYFENEGRYFFGPGTVPGNRSIAYKKGIWVNLQRLPEDLTFYADDSVFGRQMIEAGFRFAYAPNAMTYWARPRKLRQFWREQYLYGRGDGEAFIKTPLIFKFFRDNNLPLEVVPYCHAAIQLLKLRLYLGMLKAIKKCDIAAFLSMPVLIVGNNFHFAKGYVAGYKTGNINCLLCRARLQRDANGYNA